MASAIAEAMPDISPVTAEGPKALGQRPPRSRRALLARRDGRRPLLRLGLPVPVAPSRFRAGKGSAFPDPPGPRLAPQQNPEASRMPPVASPRQFRLTGGTSSATTG